MKKLKYTIIISKKRTILFVSQLKAAKRTRVQTKNDPARSPGLQPLTILIRINKNLRKFKKMLQND